MKVTVHGSSELLELVSALKTLDGGSPPLHLTLGGHRVASFDVSRVRFVEDGVEFLARPPLPKPTTVPTSGIPRRDKP